MSETDVVALDIGREPVGSMEFVEEVRVLAERVLEGTGSSAATTPPRSNPAWTASRIKPSVLGPERFTVRRRPSSVYHLSI
jgi:hypothetical protein